MTRIGILGYGNLGRGVELAIRQNDDMELAAVYTRRDPASVSIATEGVPVRSVADLETGNEDIDVLILCGGSATDLPEQTPKYASTRRLARPACARSSPAAGTRACSR